MYQLHKRINMHYLSTFFSSKLHMVFKDSGRFAVVALWLKVYIDILLSITILLNDINLYNS